jgi:citrate synthase
MAQRRLEVLSKHLSAEPSVVRDDTAEECTEELRPAPGGGRGTLTVVDNRTGRKYTLEISDGGTINAALLKQIKAGGDGVGLRTYDPG